MRGLQDFESCHAQQSDVDQGDGVLAAAWRRKTVGPVSRPVDRQTVPLKAADQRLAEYRVVFVQQEAHRR